MSKQYAAIVVLKDGKQDEISPILRITVDNGFSEYDLEPHEVASITLKEMPVICDDCGESGLEGTVHFCFDGKTQKPFTPPQPKDKSHD